MNKFSNWWNTPWTNGTFVKLCVGSMLVGAIELAAMGGVFKHMAKAESKVEPEEIEDGVIFTQTINPESEGDL